MKHENNEEIKELGKKYHILCKNLRILIGKKSKRTGNILTNEYYRKITKDHLTSFAKEYLRNHQKPFKELPDIMGCISNAAKEYKKEQNGKKKENNIEEKI